jgi:MoaA/NifB/PqqE/SkfB family radical SAM enzyme
MDEAILRAVRTPVTLWLELETKCNLRCRFCYNFWKDGSTPEPVRSNTAQVLSNLDRLFAQAPCTQVALSGGEPLLRRDLEEIVSFIARRDISVVVTTNGSLLTPARVRSLKAAGAGLFQIPLLSDDASLHDYLSGGASWNDAVRAIMACVDIGAPVVPVFVATQPNLGSLRGVVQLAHLLDCGRLIVNKFIPGGLGALNREELETGADEVLGQEIVEVSGDLERLDMTIELGVPLALSSAIRAALPRVRFASCPVRQGQSHFTVDSAGHLKECNHSAEVLGDLQAESLASLRQRSSLLRGRVQSKYGISVCQFSCG